MIYAGVMLLILLLITSIIHITIAIGIFDKSKILFCFYLVLGVWYIVLGFVTAVILVKFVFFRIIP